VTPDYQALAEKLERDADVLRAKVTTLIRQEREAGLPLTPAERLVEWVIAKDADDCAAALRQAHTDRQTLDELAAWARRRRSEQVPKVTDRRPRPSDREWEERWEGENKRAEAAEAKLARYEAALQRIRFLPMEKDRPGGAGEGKNRAWMLLDLASDIAHAALDQEEE
jgi:hypothetical protein